MNEKTESREPEFMLWDFEVSHTVMVPVGATEEEAREAMAHPLPEYAW
jgi:hypothetical protein